MTQLETIYKCNEYVQLLKNARAKGMSAETQEELREKGKEIGERSGVDILWALLYYNKGKVFRVQCDEDGEKTEWFATIPNGYTPAENSTEREITFRKDESRYECLEVGEWRIGKSMRNKPNAFALVTRII